MSMIQHHPSVGLELSQSLVEVALEQARAQELVVSVTVVGRSGQMVAFAGMDGATPLTEVLSRDKAYSSAVTGGYPTAGLAGMRESDPVMFDGMTTIDRIVVFPGGVPLFEDGELIGAIGVGGAPDPAQDAAVAQAAADRVDALVSAA